MAQDSDTWMWERARSIVDRADRIQRRFFQLSSSGTDGPTWEPPVDVFQTDTELWILTAMPGVALQTVTVRLEGEALIVRGARTLPSALKGAKVHRLEIPYGRFERRIHLPPGRYQPRTHQLVDGCLVLSFKILP